MALFKCEICGNTLESNNESVVTCKCCGTQHSLLRLDDDRNGNICDQPTDIYKNQNEDKTHTGMSKTKEITEPVVSAVAPNIAPLLKRAFMFLEDEEWNAADEYCERVLDIDPENARAYLGKLMAEQKVKIQADLKDCAQPFDGCNSYRKILRFGDEILKTELTGYIEHINVRNEKARLEGVSVHKKEQKNLAKNEQESQESKEVANAKHLKKIAIIAVLIFCVIIAFAIVLTTVIIPNNKYNHALTLMKEGKYNEAIAVFESLDGHKDSAGQIKECQYMNAVALMNAGKFDEAYNIFQQLGNYKDSVNQIDRISLLKITSKLQAANVGSYVKFGAYEQDNNISNGKEEIEWLVLEKKGDRLLVISRYALECRPYNTTYQYVTWQTCSLRKWLNTDFIDAAFSAQEAKMIPMVTVSADKNPNWATDPGEVTQDRVFLLSITEVNKYFYSESAKKCTPTNYAIANGVFEYDGGCFWWLRSPGGSGSAAANVEFSGYVFDSGNGVDQSIIAVRPVMWIKID